MNSCMLNWLNATVTVTKVAALARLFAAVLLSACLVSPQAGAQSGGLQLGTGSGSGGDAPASGGTLDLGPASTSNTESAATKPAAPAQPAAPPQMPSDLGAAPLSLEDLERQTIGDWELACVKNGGPCFMAQIGEDKDGIPVLEMVVRKLPEPQTVQGVSVIAVTDIITPLGVVLTSGLAMQIDSSEERRAPFQVCTEQGCLVREPLTEETINSLKRGGKAKITVVAAQQGPVVSVLSLKGFTKAYGSLR